MMEVNAGVDGGRDVAPVLLVSAIRPAQHSEGRVRLSDVQPLSLPKLDIKHYSDEGQEPGCLCLSPHPPVMVTFLRSDSLSSST